jgi:hypothetical protein
LKSQAFVAALLAALAGCSSFVRLDGPRTVAPGMAQSRLAPSFYAGHTADSVRVNVDYLIRQGVSERVDFGVRLHFVGAGADVKWQLVRSADPTRGFELAVAPGGGCDLDLTWGTQAGKSAPMVCQANLPLMMSYTFNVPDFGPEQLVFSPQLAYLRPPDLPSGVFNVGGTVAFGNLNGAGRGTALVVGFWKAVDAGHPGLSFSHAGGWVVQPGLVFRWDR